MYIYTYLLLRVVVRATTPVVIVDFLTKSLNIKRKSGKIIVGGDDEN